MKSRLSRHTLTALTCFFCVVAGWSVFNTNARVFIQKTVQDNRRGSVFATIGGTSNLMMPAAYAIGGICTRFIPVYTAFILGGSVIVLSGLFLLFSKNHGSSTSKEVKACP